jgi:hypothetical protein
MLQNRVYLGEITHKGESYPGQQPWIIEQRLWEKVQEQLKSNIQSERKRIRSAEQGPLLGLIYDADGTLFNPTHANKNGSGTATMYRKPSSRWVKESKPERHRGSRLGRLKAWLWATCESCSN